MDVVLASVTLGERDLIVSVRDFGTPFYGSLKFFVDNISNPFSQHCGGSSICDRYIYIYDISKYYLL